MTTLQIGAGWFPEAPGGLERVYHALAQHLPDAGVAVRGLVTGTDAVAAETGGRIRAFAPPDASLLRRWRAVRAGVRDELGRAPDVIASHFALYAAPALDLLHRRPFVVHFHGPWAFEGRAERSSGALVKATLEGTVYRRARRVVVLSRAFGDLAVRTYGVPHDRIRVVPGGVDAARFGIAADRPAARARLGWPDDGPIVLCVRRLVHRMGVEGLIDAWSTVRRHAPDARLFIAGRGPLAGALQARVDAAGLGDRVRLLGFVPDADLPLAYRAADVSVVPTVALEGFGLITLESLAAGTPVLVTPVGGLPETVQGLDPALVLGGADATALADGIGAALAGRTALPTPEACRRYAADHFSWSAAARRTRAVYEEAVEAAP